MEFLRRHFPQTIFLPLAMIAALTFYAWADLGWIGIAIVVGVCVIFAPAAVKELRRERRRKEAR